MSIELLSYVPGLITFLVAGLTLLQKRKDELDEHLNAIETIDADSPKPRFRSSLWVQAGLMLAVAAFAVSTWATYDKELRTQRSNDEAETAKAELNRFMEENNILAGAAKGASQWIKDALEKKDGGLIDVSKRISEDTTKIEKAITGPEGLESTAKTIAQTAQGTLKEARVAARDSQAASIASKQAAVSSRNAGSNAEAASLKASRILEPWTPGKLRGTLTFTYSKTGIDGNDGDWHRALYAKLVQAILLESISAQKLKKPRLTLIDDRGKTHELFYSKGSFGFSQSYFDITAKVTNGQLSNVRIPPGPLHPQSIHHLACDPWVSDKCKDIIRSIAPNPDNFPLGCPDLRHVAKRLDLAHKADLQPDLMMPSGIEAGFTDQKLTPILRVMFDLGLGSSAESIDRAEQRYRQVSIDFRSMMLSIGITAEPADYYFSKPLSAEELMNESRHAYWTGFLPENPRWIDFGVHLNSIVSKGNLPDPAYEDDRYFRGNFLYLNRRNYSRDWLDLSTSTSELETLDDGEGDMRLVVIRKVTRRDFSATDPRS